MPWDEHGELPPRYQAMADQFAAEMVDFGNRNVIGAAAPEDHTETNLRAVREQFARRGVLLENMRVEGDAIVGDVVRPRGVG